MYCFARPYYINDKVLGIAIGLVKFNYERCVWHVHSKCCWHLSLGQQLEVVNVYGLLVSAHWILGLEIEFCANGGCQWHAL